MTMAPEQVQSEPRAMKRFSVDDYHRLAEAGIIAPEERTELIEGVVYEMAPPGAQHASLVDRLARLFFGALADRAQIRIQSPIRLDPHSEPQPDVALLRLRPDEYAGALPGPADVLLVVEVAHATLRFDLGPKAVLYARHGVPELWVVDGAAGRVVVHREPGPAGYGSIVALGSGGALSPLAFPGDGWPVEVLLGPARPSNA